MPNRTELATATHQWRIERDRQMRKDKVNLCRIFFFIEVNFIFGPNNVAFDWQWHTVEAHLLLCVYNDI